MGIKMRGLTLLAGVCGGFGAILPDIDHILIGERALLHSWLGIMAVLLCLGLYLTLSRRLS